MENAFLYLIICGGLSVMTSAFTIAAVMLSSRISQNEARQAEWGPAEPAADDQPLPKGRPSHSPANR